MFSSRKLRNKIPPRVPMGAVVRVAGEDKGPIDDDGSALSEKTYMETREYDKFRPAVFRGYHVNSPARGEEEEVYMDDGVNTEREEYALAQGESPPKRRRMDNDDRLSRNYISENGPYSHGNLLTFQTDPPKDSLDEVRKLADAIRLLSAERILNGNQVDEILNPTPSSGCLLSPLDVRSADDEFFDEYNRAKGSRQASADKGYGKPLESMRASDDDRFLFDNFIQREHNVYDNINPVISGDGNLNSCRQAREMIDEKRSSMNNKLENRYHLDCNGSPSTAVEHSAGLRFNDRIESKPNFGTCSLEDFSSQKNSRSLYPIVEGRITGNDNVNIRYSTSLTRDAEYTETIDGRGFDVGRFRKSERVYNGGDFHMVTGPFRTMDYLSSSSRNQKSSSYPDMLLPEKRHSQLTAAHNFDPSHLNFSDATITRVVPYIPEHPSFSHEYSAAMAANGNSDLVPESHPRHGSPGSLYSFKNDSSPYFPELKKSDRSLDVAPEFGEYLQSTSGHQSHKTTNYIPNSDLSKHMDISTSAPVSHRSSMFPKPSLIPPDTDPEYTEREKRLLSAYPSKSNENRTSQRASKHAEGDMEMLAGKDFMLADKDFIVSEAKDVSAGIYLPEIDISRYEGLYLKLKKNQGISEAPDSDSNTNRRSVFTRLTSRLEHQVGEETNDGDFNCYDRYMGSTADEVMEMLQQSNNLSVWTPRKSKVSGQPKHRESAVTGKQIQSHIKTNHSIMEKKKLNESNLVIPESTDEVPEETRIMDFKRRGRTNKNLTGTSIDSAAGNKTIGSSEEAKSSMKTTLKRKKLIRPVFRKDEALSDATCSNSQLPGLIIDKLDKQSYERAVSICEAEMHGDNSRLHNVLASVTRLHNVLASVTHQSMDGDGKEHSTSAEQKDLLSTNHELKDHETSNTGLQNVASPQVPLQETKHKSFRVKTSVEGILSKDIDSIVRSLHPGESNPDGLELGAGCRNSLIEENKIRTLRSKRRIIRTRRTVTEPSQPEHGS